MSKPIPIKVAKDIANSHDWAIVTVVAWDAVTGKQHVTTYGKSKQECEWAAMLGNRIKREILGWPEDLCNAVPARAKKKAVPPAVEAYECDGCGLEKAFGGASYCPECQEDNDDWVWIECESCHRKIEVRAHSGVTECSKCLE